VSDVTYRIEFVPLALREFQALPRKLQERLAPKFDGLATNPRPRGVEKLKGAKDQYRIRMGAYRVIYTIEDERLIVLVLRIGHRREMYRGH
jgi:mRNA interferase RelE/StbE